MNNQTKKQDGSTLIVEIETQNNKSTSRLIKNAFLSIAQALFINLLFICFLLIVFFDGIFLNKNQLPSFNISYYEILIVAICLLAIFYVIALHVTFKKYAYVVFEKDFLKYFNGPNREKFKKILYENIKQISIAPNGRLYCRYNQSFLHIKFLVGKVLFYQRDQEEIFKILDEFKKRNPLIEFCKKNVFQVFIGYLMYFIFFYLLCFIIFFIYFYVQNDLLKWDGSFSLSHNMKYVAIFSLLVLPPAVFFTWKDSSRV